MKAILPIPGLTCTAPLVPISTSPPAAYRAYLIQPNRSNSSLKTVVRFETEVAWCFAESLTQFNFFLKSFFVQIWVITLLVLAIDLLILCAGSHSRNQSYSKNGHSIIHASAEVTGAVVCSKHAYCRSSRWTLIPRIFYWAGTA